MLLFLTTFQIITLPWFDRVWIIQEYTLAQRTPWALLGPGVFMFDVLRPMMLEALPRLAKGSNHQVGGSMVAWAAALEMGPGLKTDIIDLPTTIQSDSFRGKVLGDQLVYLLLSKGANQCAVAHDHIYGILSLADLKLLPERLRPDYNQSF